MAGPAISLSARLDEISLCLQLPKANQLLAHLALLAGPEALSRPATAQNLLGRGRSPPCAPPCAATRRPGWATPSLRACEAQTKVPPSAGDRGQPQSKTHRTPNSAKAVISEFPAVWSPLFSRLLTTTTAAAAAAQPSDKRKRGRQPGRNPNDGAQAARIHNQHAVDAEKTQELGWGLSLRSYISSRQARRAR
jgi:hypothetical protein